jgi:hypothetical protein
MQRSSRLAHLGNNLLRRITKVVGGRKLTLVAQFNTPFDTIQPIPHWIKLNLQVR